MTEKLTKLAALDLCENAISDLLALTADPTPVTPRDCAAIRAGIRTLKTIHAAIRRGSWRNPRR